MRTSLVSIATLAVLLTFTGPAPAQTLGCTSGGAGGAFPTSGTGGGGTYPSILPPAEFSSVLQVTSIPPGATAVTEVKLNGLNHTFTGDVQIVLTSPDKVSYNLFNQVGFACNFAGDFIIVAPQHPPFQLVGCGNGSPAHTPGKIDQLFNSWPNGTHGIFNTSLSAVAPATGDWTLTIYDWEINDIGTLASWEICFGTPPPPPQPPATPCNGPGLTTVLSGNNTGAVGGQLFFELEVTNPAGILLSQMGINAGGATGRWVTLDVHIKPNTFLNDHANPGVWNLLSSGGGFTAGPNQPTTIELADAWIPPGWWGISLVLHGAPHVSRTGSNWQVYYNNDLAMHLGAAQDVPWSGNLIGWRVFSGTLRYNCTTPIVSYCTAGTTTNGCVATISASAQPSASAANACQISVANVEGQKSGLIFYSLTGRHNSAWNASSFLCVKSPTQRTGTQTASGTVDACDGTLSLDWNAYLSSHPNALGNPFQAGEKLQLQAWFRDPPAGKSTNLSNAIEMYFLP
jgi:hypothetical protein